METIFERELSHRVARALSEIFSPVCVAPVLFFALSWSTSQGDLGQTLLLWGIIVGGLILLPFTFVIAGMLRGRYTDHHVSVREQRMRPLIFALLCALTVCIVLLLLQAPSALLTAVISVLFTYSIATLVTTRWKISFHMASFAGAVTVLAIVYGPPYALLGLLLPLMGWARWRVHAHTPWQAFAGALLAIVVTTATYALIPH